MLTIASEAYNDQRCHEKALVIVEKWLLDTVQVTDLHILKERLLVLVIAAKNLPVGCIAALEAIKKISL